MPDLKALGAWAPLLEKELHAPYFEELQKKVADAYAHTAVFPPEADVFHALGRTRIMSRARRMVWPSRCRRG